MKEMREENNKNEQIYKPTLWKREKIYVLDWEMLGRCLQKIEYLVRQDGVMPTTIVGISRGGLVATTYFANIFNTSDVHILGIVRNTSNEKYSWKQEPQFFWMSPHADLRDRSILLVDDINGEGRTLALAIQLLQEQGANCIKTVVIACQQKSSFPVDYTAVVLDDWIVFPWETFSADEGIKFERLVI